MIAAGEPETSQRGNRRGETKQTAGGEERKTAKRDGGEGNARLSWCMAGRGGGHPAGVGRMGLT